MDPAHLEYGHYVAYFFGGAFLTNAVPHFVSGVMGRAFQSPFAKPPGEGLSTSTVNVVWGFLNLVIAYGLVGWIGAFDPHRLDYMGAFGAGMLLFGVVMGRRFGRFHGGNAAVKA